MFDGFLSLGGIEVINAARTQAYLRNLMPGFPYARITTDYNTVQDALEDGPYTSPARDGAEWVENTDDVLDVQRNPTHGFYGLYPLSIEGIDDSTMTAPVTESIFDGGTVGAERDSTRSIRVHGLLIGEDKLAVQSGMSWLRNAVRANSCGMHGDLCGYQDLRYFLAKPEVCIPSYTDDYRMGDTLDMGSIDPSSSPLIVQNEGPITSTVPMGGNWVFPLTDGVIIRWGALDQDGAVTQSYGPVTLRRSNYVTNPTFRSNTSGWTPTGGTITRHTGSPTGRTFATVDQASPVTLRSNFLPDPSFEHGDPETFGWRSLTPGGIVQTTDGSAPQGTKVAVVAGVAGQTEIEATATGPDLDGDLVGGWLSFWGGASADDIVVSVLDPNGVQVQTFTISHTLLTSTYNRVGGALTQFAKNYVIQLTTAGTQDLRVDGFLLEAGAGSAGTYFDGATTAGGGTSYYFVGGNPAGASRSLNGSYTSFSVTPGMLDAPVGDGVLSFSASAPYSDPTIQVDLTDPVGTNVGSVTIVLAPGWTRYSLGTGFSRSVTATFTSASGRFSIDNVMFESGTTANPYLDGNSAPTAGYSTYWVGAPDASVSRIDWTGTTQIDAVGWRPFLSLDQGYLNDVKFAYSLAREIPMSEQIFDYDRYMHRVYCTRGVQTIKEYDLSVGAMTEVDFIITAATPWSFSPETPLFFNGLIPNSILHEDIKTNLSSNPSAEVSTAGFVSVPGTTGVAALTSAAPSTTTAFGTKVLKSTWTTATTVAGGGAYMDVPVTAGYTYCFGFGHVKSSIGNRLRLNVEWRTASTTISTSSGTQTVVTAGAINTGFQQLALLAPATATIARVGVYSVAGTSFANWSISSYLELDGMMVNFGSLLRSYFDGSTASTSVYTYSWLGTTGLSQSTRVETVVTTNPLVDPNVPAIPAPPRPPVVADVALTTQNDWRRYYVPIPADDVAAWASTVVNIQLTAVTTAVHLIRVRFHPNPFGYANSAVDIYNYCGEFILSYLPANSVLTVSGLIQRAYAQVAGAAAQPADQLLYGTGGTPMDWPEMSCAIDYLMTVDIPPSSDISNLLFDISLNRRD